MTAPATERSHPVDSLFPDDLPLESSIAETFGLLAAYQLPAQTPATNRLFARLNPTDLQLVRESLRDRLDPETFRQVFEGYATSDPKHFRREILRYGTHFLPHLVGAKTGLCDANPPAHIHCMMRKPIFIGDQYSGDLFIEELEQCGGQVESDGHYLDFGCSSGAAVRYLAAAYPEAQWYGCDPVKESIAWASDHLPGIDFQISPQWPPLPYPSQHFNGVYAISIWSHFSERAALAWFDEMARIIKPDGVLMFTTHGAATLGYSLRTGWRSDEGIRAIAADLAQNRYRFEDVYRHNDEVQSQLDSISDWGDAFLPLSWVILHLHHQWDLMGFRPGRNQANQDLYLLRRKSVG
ncbi:class I SAM-dependent methyltransferase [Tautonia rosea]|uniref:class I SAM-dependent methyltransferase n=1 Tax=Tautonia rosea TaxID=2728037 RepID=UPI001476526A|nr:class I SAM-dependent methyltransferase [Tautonia rosea]